MHTRRRANARPGLKNKIKKLKKKQGPEAVSEAVLALVTKAVTKINLSSPDRLKDTTIHHHIGSTKP